MSRKCLQGEIESLTLEAQGVCRVDGKVYFIDGALPGEFVEFEVRRSRRQHGHGKLTRVIREHGDNGRVASDCDYFGVCGGCSFRHYEKSRQLETKQQALLDAYQRIGKVTPLDVTPPLTADWLHYRRKARLGIRYVEKKGGALVGFREKNSRYITPLQRCLTLARPLSDLLPGLAVLMNNLSINQQIPQIELAQGDNQIDLVFRHLADFNRHDIGQLVDYAKNTRTQVFLQPQGLDSIHPLYPESPEPLYYELSEPRIKYTFSATDFIQVNAEANQLLVRLAMDYLALQRGDRVLDLYCGIGNFSLPVASECEQVLGVEGDQRLIDKAIFNAKYNGIDNARFHQQDLADARADHGWLTSRYNKVLLDPARSGAAQLCERLITLQPEKIVYVSCNPATLSRDAGILVNQGGYKLMQTGIINMFPHTAHIESIGVFGR